MKKMTCLVLYSISVLCSVNASSMNPDLYKKEFHTEIDKQKSTNVLPMSNNASNGSEKHDSKRKNVRDQGFDVTLPPVKELFGKKISEDTQKSTKRLNSKNKNSETSSDRSDVIVREKKIKNKDVQEAENGKDLHSTKKVVEKQKADMGDRTLQKLWLAFEKENEKTKKVNTQKESVPQFVSVPVYYNDIDLRNIKYIKIGKTPYISADVIITKKILKYKKVKLEDFVKENLELGAEGALPFTLNQLNMYNAVKKEHIRKIMPMPGVRDIASKRVSSYNKEIHTIKMNQNMLPDMSTRKSRAVTGLPNREGSYVNDSYILYNNRATLTKGDVIYGWEVKNITDRYVSLKNISNAKIEKSKIYF